MVHFIKLKHINPKWQIGVIYHSPSTSDADFINYLRNVLGSNCEISESNIVVGDFNINLNNTSTYSTQLIDLMKSYSMHQKVNFDTRITDTSRTKIDLLFLTLMI